MKESKASVRYAFEHGVLTVRTPACRMRIRWQPQPSALERSSLRNEWTPFTPDFRLLPGLEDAAPGIDAMRAFRATVPEQIVRVTSRFSTHHWSLMQFMHNHRAAQELAATAPALAWALANPMLNNGLQTPPSNIAHRPRKELVGILGYPETGSMVRLFGRLCTEELQPGHLLSLRDAIAQDPTLPARLNHFDRLTPAMLSVIAHPTIGPLCTAPLLEDLMERTTLPARTVIAFADALELRQSLPAAERLPLPELTSTRRLESCIDSLLHEAQAYSRECMERSRDVPSLVFQPPPFEGNAAILPITCRADLIAEGRTQQNCVPTYERRIREGRLYVYRILTPQRATLSIVQGEDGRWHRSELETRGNHPVSQETLRYVDGWLKSRSAAGQREPA